MSGSRLPPNIKLLVVMFSISMLLFVGSDIEAQDTGQDQTASRAIPGSQAAAREALSRDKEKEIVAALEKGNRAISTGDTNSAQAHFEHAFVVSIAHGAKGSLLARVYMALGALFTGHLEQTRQGIDFMKKALSIDPTATPNAEIVNPKVTVILNTARESLGIAISKPVPVVESRDEMTAPPVVDKEADVVSDESYKNQVQEIHTQPVREEIIDKEPLDKQKSKPGSSGGWAKGAAVSGFVSAGAVAIMGTISLTPLARDDWVPSFILGMIDLSIVTAMGPVIGAGSYSARSETTVTGSRGCRVAGWIMYSTSLLVGTIYSSPVSLFDEFVWIGAISVGTGVLSLALLSTDAWLSYKQSKKARSSAASRSIINTRISLEPVIATVQTGDKTSGLFAGLSGRF